MHSAVRALLLILLLLPVHLFGQVRLNPAFSSPVPEYPIRILKKFPESAWNLPGYANQFSWIQGGFFKRSRETFYMQRYPETDIVMARVSVKKDADGYVGDGPASYRTPDFGIYKWGNFKDGLPQGEWSMVILGRDSINQLKPELFELCPQLRADIPPLEVDQLLKQHTLDSISACNTQIVKATFKEGKLNGQYSIRTLSGQIIHLAEYARDSLVGEQFIFQKDGNLLYHIIHAPFKKPDTLVSPIAGKNQPSHISRVVEIQPIFPNSCKKIDVTQASAEELAYSKQCSERAMLEYIFSTVEYPESAREIGLSGMSIVEFIVEKDGRITGISTVGFVSKSIDEEARRIVSQMPVWSPGIQRGRPVRVKFYLPINFKLE